MAKFSEIAAELRILAEALDEQPDAETVVPWMSFYCYEKEPFLTIARALPRPLKKEVEDPGSQWAKLRVRSKSLKFIEVNASVAQAKTCEIIEPAGSQPFIAVNPYCPLTRKNWWKDD